MRTKRSRRLGAATVALVGDVQADTQHVVVVAPHASSPAAEVATTKSRRSSAGRSSYQAETDERQDDQTLWMRSAARLR